MGLVGANKFNHVSTIKLKSVFFILRINQIKAQSGKLLSNEVFNFVDKQTDSDDNYKRYLRNFTTFC